MDTSTTEDPKEDPVDAGQTTSGSGLVWQ